MPNENDFDPAAYDAAIGLSNTTTFSDEGGPDGVRVDPSASQSLGVLAGQQPQGVPPVNPSQPDGNAGAVVPTYLTEHMVQPSTEEKPVVNWQERYQTSFGTDGDQPAEYTQDAFETESIRRNYTDQYLQDQPNLPYFDSILAAPAEEGVRIVTDEVTALIQSQGRRSQKAIDEELDVYIEDGQLTEEGGKMLTRIKDAAKQQADAIRQKASAYAAQVEKDFSAFKNEQIAQIKTFAPYGIGLPEATQARLLDRARSGEVQAWLDKPADTVQEQVRRSLLLALISDDAAFSEWVKDVDQRGFKHGKGQSIARQLQ